MTFAGLGRQKSRITIRVQVKSGRMQEGHAWQGEGDGGRERGVQANSSKTPLPHDKLGCMQKSESEC